MCKPRPSITSKILLGKGLAESQIKNLTFMKKKMIMDSNKTRKTKSLFYKEVKRLFFLGENDRLRSRICEFDSISMVTCEEDPPDNLSEFFNDRLFIFILENKGVDLTLYDAFKSFCEICLRGCNAINREMIAASVCYFALVKLKYKSRLIWEAHPDIIKFLDLGDFSRYPEVINLGVQIYNDFYMINHKLLEAKNALKKN